MNYESFERILKIAQKHVDFLKEHREDGVLTPEEYDMLIAVYEEDIAEGYKILNETE